MAVTLDSTLFFKMASKAKQREEETDTQLSIPITRREALFHRPNKWVTKRGPGKGRPYPILVYEEPEKETYTPVCLYNGIWHQVKKDTETGKPWAFNPLPSIHDYVESSSSKSNKEEDPEDLEEPTQTNVTIRLTPVLSQVHMPQPRDTSTTTTTHKPLSPLSGMLTTVGTTTTTIQAATGSSAGGTGTGSSQPTIQPATLQAIQASLHAVLWCHRAPPSRQPTRGGGGGSGGGSRGGGGRGGGRGGSGPAAPAPQGVILAMQDVKAMGSPPQIFTRDRLQANNFIEEVKGYLHLNNGIAGFNSPIKKVAFTLTLLKGDKVTIWVQDIGNWIDGLNPAQDNVSVMWNQFLVEFATQFQDSTKEYWARSELDKITMQFPFINKYITFFEEYTCKAGYTQGNNKTIQLFLKGLSCRVLVDIIRPPMPNTYDAIKQKAIESTRSQQILKDIITQQRTPLGGGFRGGSFRNFNGPN